MNLSDDQLKAERRRLSAAFDGVLDEPVPDRLKALLAEPAPAANVVSLGAVRAQRKAMSSWAAWGGMAATLVLGTLIGTRLAPSPGGDDRLVASGAIAKALEGKHPRDFGAPSTASARFTTTSQPAETVLAEAAAVPGCGDGEPSR